MRARANRAAWGSNAVRCASYFHNMFATVLALPGLSKDPGFLWRAAAGLGKRLWRGIQDGALDQLEAGGKPSTWFPPEGLAEHIVYFHKLDCKQ